MKFNLNWLHNWRMSRKISALVLISAAFMCVVGYLGYYYYEQQNAAMNVIYRQTVQSVKLLDNVNANSKAVDALSLEELLAPDDNFRKQLVLTEIQTRENQIAKDLIIYASMAKDPFETNKLPPLRQAVATYNTEQHRAFQLAVGGDKLNAYRYYSNNALPSVDIMHIIVPQLVDFNNTRAQQVINAGNRTFATVERVLLILPMCATLLVILLGIGMSRLIVKPLKQMLRNVKQVANGNLVLEDISVASKDEVGQLGSSFTVMANNLRGLVTQVFQSSESLAVSSDLMITTMGQFSEASNQMVVAIAEVAQDSEQQVGAVNETAKAIEQIVMSVQQIADNSDRVSGLMESTSGATEAGKRAVDKVVQQMDAIGIGTDVVQRAMANLTVSSQQINEIVNVIAEITGQTNLLALNAAIEAARAGDQGRGFAVVAQEIRLLANQSQAANQQIKELINTNQAKINEALSAVNTEIEDIQSGVSLVDIASGAFAQIDGLVHQVSSEVKEISVAIQNAAAGGEQIKSAIQDIERTGKSTAGTLLTVSAGMQEQGAGINQIAVTSQGLDKMARELHAAISQFSV
ncbi:MAG: methyl-accepting chemotaxis protein [Peptococcaceae bacterium]|nr:methyl-accepting chemotaxis protein [Peptococcaceae bacterium]